MATQEGAQASWRVPKLRSLAERGTRPQVSDEGDPGAPGKSGGRVATRRGFVAAFTGSHRYILDYPACDWDALIATLLTLHDQQREANLDTRRGHRPRMTAPGTGRRPVRTLADRLLATILHQRLALPQVAIAGLFSVRPETISKRIRDIRQLLDQAGYTIQPGPHRLASLDDLPRLAAAEGITIAPKIKTAC